MNWPTALASTIENAIWSGCRRPERSPDGVALRPEVLALVVEALGMFVDDDAERQAVEPRHDAAVELRRARIDGDRVALRAHRRPAARRRRASACRSVPLLYGVPRMMKLSAASPQISRSQSSWTRTRRRRSPRPWRGSSDRGRRSARSRHGTAHRRARGRRPRRRTRRESRDAPRRRSSCSSAPCRRPGRTRWCAPDAACRAGTIGNGRRIAASTPGSPPIRE